MPEAKRWSCPSWPKAVAEVNSLVLDAGLRTVFGFRSNKVVLVSGSTMRMEWEADATVPEARMVSTELAMLSRFAVGMDGGEGEGSKGSPAGGLPQEPP